MSRVPITEAYRSDEGADLFPRLKMETGEFARLCLPEDDGWPERVHTMRAPVIEHGVAIRTNKPRKDGTTYEDFMYGFVAQRICMGDPAVLEDKNVDPARCPGCESSVRGTRDMAPHVRWAIPVIRYSTRTKHTADVRNPPGAEVLIWALTGKMFNQLLDCVKQWREINGIPAETPVHLRDMDIVLECESGDFQRVKFHAPRMPAYRDAAVGADVGRLIGALWADESNRPTDEQLRAACGRDGDVHQMRADVEKVESRWRVADGAAVPAADPLGGAAPGQQGALDTGLASLLDGGRPAAGLQPAAAQAAAADPFGSQASTATPATTTATAAPAAAGPSPTEPTAATGAAGPDPFGGRGLDQFAPALPSAQDPAPGPSTTAPSPASPSAPQPAQADPFGGGSATSATPSAVSAAPTAAAAPAAPASSPTAPPNGQPAKAAPLSFDQILDMTRPPGAS